MNTPAVFGFFIRNTSGRMAKVTRPMNQNKSMKASICACRPISSATAVIELGDCGLSPRELRSGGTAGLYGLLWVIRSPHCTDVRRATRELATAADAHHPRLVIVQRPRDPCYPAAR